MAGRPGRSGGHNRIPVELHLQCGTFNPTRHKLPPAVVPAVSPRHDPIPDDLVEGLSGRGLKFMQECWRQYSGWTPATLALLREVCCLMSELDTVRGTPAERSAQRLLASMLRN